MSRIIGLDYGKKRTGIAVTDPMQLIASPLKTIPSYTVVPFLKTYLSQEDVESIIVGWPLELSGKAGIATRLVSQFIRLLRRYFSHVPILYYDERFTSVIAKKSLIASGVKLKKRQQKTALDAMSAALILRSFMEKKRWAETVSGKLSK